MRIEGKHYHTIWLKEDEENVVQVFDQRLLPHQLVFHDLKTYQDAAFAIKTDSSVQSIIHIHHNEQWGCLKKPSSYHCRVCAV